MTEQRNEWTPPSEHGWPCTSGQYSAVFEGDSADVVDEVARQTRRLINELIRTGALRGGSDGVQISFAVDFHPNGTEVMGVSWINGEEPPKDARNEIGERIDLVTWQIEQRLHELGEEG